MGRYIMALLVFCMAYIANAQDESEPISSNDSTIFSLSDSLLHQHLLPGNQHVLDNKINPFDFGVEVGTSVSVNFDGGYGTNLYVAPHLSFAPNAKWQFNVTPIIARSTFHDMPLWIYPGYAATTSGTVNHLALYAQGAYNINEKLYVGASVMTETLMFEQNELAPPMTNFNSIGASAFVGYKFSDHFRVHAEFGVNRNPYRNSNYIGLPPNTFISPGLRNPYNPF